MERLTLVRRVIRRTLDAEPDIAVVGDVATLEDALLLAQRMRPRVSLVSAAHLGGRPADAVRTLTEVSPETSVILLSGQPDGADIARAVQAGLRSCLSYASTVSDLVDAIREVHLGNTVVDQPALTALFDHMSHRTASGEEPAAAINRLTAKERVVLGLLAVGASKDDIASELGISTETVRTHAQRLLTKLGVHSRLEAVAFVNQHDLLPELMSRD